MGIGTYKINASIAGYFSWFDLIFLRMYLKNIFFGATEMTFNLVNYQSKEALLCSSTLLKCYFRWTVDSELNKPPFNYNQESY